MGNIDGGLLGPPRLGLVPLPHFGGYLGLLAAVLQSVGLLMSAGPLDTLWAIRTP